MSMWDELAGPRPAGDRTHLAPAATGPRVVEGLIYSIDAEKVYFVVPTWDGGKHRFGPAKYDPALIMAVGDEVLVVFPSRKTDSSWIVATTGAPPED